MATASHPSWESEVALIIISRQPEEVVARLVDLSSIPGYHLLPRDSLRMRDLYFDTQDRAFESQKLALRVREIGAKNWLAMKGPSKKMDWGGVERLEIEQPWSQDAMTKVVKALADRGIETVKQWCFSEHGHPRQVLQDFGFQVIQDRETHRHVRNVVRLAEAADPALAELVIDTVVYHLGDRAIRHYEVEIESKADTGVSVILPITDGLSAELGQVLQRWDHSKLAIGFALEKLLNRGDLDGMIAPNGNLEPAAYDKIDGYLRVGDG